MSEKNQHDGEKFTAHAKAEYIASLQKAMIQIGNVWDSVNKWSWCFDSNDEYDLAECEAHLKAAEDVLRDLICRAKCRSTEE